MAVTYGTVSNVQYLKYVNRWLRSSKLQEVEAKLKIEDFPFP